MKPRERRFANRLMVRFIPGANEEQEAYLWTVYFWSRPAFFKSYHEYKQHGVKMTEFWFPKWWQERIVNGLP